MYMITVSMLDMAHESSTAGTGRLRANTDVTKSI
eukprot:CAMPEP_0174727510 /NCGR_PEP_ID=MMETSP1094-20130205/49927_1 /TAXON_ID=156173 /ORGANISM="Chrysochromulina brevifilum, Strain UTEX LB 985" /LENGTH=33 /DNA_ID= /DNA_START= /DNA_END= /DNA_ORIENTATION=